MAIQKWLKSCEKSFYSHLVSLIGPMLALCSAITPSELQDSKDFKLSLHPLVRRLGSLSNANKVRNFWSVLEPEMDTSKHTFWGWFWIFSLVFPFKPLKNTWASSIGKIVCQIWMMMMMMMMVMMMMMTTTTTTTTVPFIAKQLGLDQPSYVPFCWIPNPHAPKNMFNKLLPFTICVLFWVAFYLGQYFFSNKTMIRKRYQCDQLNCLSKSMTRPESGQPMKWPPTTWCTPMRLFPTCINRVWRSTRKPWNTFGEHLAPMVSNGRYSAKLLNHTFPLDSTGMAPQWYLNMGNRNLSLDCSWTCLCGDRKRYDAVDSSYSQ